MPLQLKSVEPSRGMRWIGDAFRLFARRPLGFALMFVAFIGAALVISLLPRPFGDVLVFATVPMLSLGFMVASQSALLGGPVHPGQFIEPLRGDPARRRALLLLCAIYGLAAYGILLLFDAVSNGALQRLMVLMANGNPPREEIDALLNEPGLSAAVLASNALATLLSIPFWHAPALVHWGAQGVAQSLFSSTLALWRNKGAFFVYGLVWLAVVLAFTIVGSQVAAILAANLIVPLVVLSLMLLFPTVFYVSLLFTFNDSFGGAEARP